MQNLKKHALAIAEIVDDIDNFGLIFPSTTDSDHKLNRARLERRLGWLLKEMDDLVKLGVVNMDYIEMSRKGPQKRIGDDE